MSKLVINKDMSIKATYDMSGAEVDLLSISILGKKGKVSEKRIHSYMQGVFEKLVAKNIVHVPQKEILETCVANHRDLSKYSPQELASYKRGWAHAGAVMAESKKND